MKTISTWQHLEEFGIVLLTSEACGLGYRLLCDVTPKGKALVEKCLAVGHLTLHEPWNRGPDSAPHIGSIMLSPEMFAPLAVFALLEGGYKEVWVTPSGNTVHAPETGDPADLAAVVCRRLGVAALKRFAYRGTAGDRNVHQMSGRVE